MRHRLLAAIVPCTLVAGVLGFTRLCSQVQGLLLVETTGTLFWFSHRDGSAHPSAAPQPFVLWDGVPRGTAFYRRGRRRCLI